MFAVLVLWSMKNPLAEHLQGDMSEVLVVCGVWFVYLV